MQKKKRSQWRKLDNAAQAFPAATGKKDTRVFRLYCELKEDVIEEVLQKAVECTLEKYPLYCSVHTRAGTTAHNVGQLPESDSPPHRLSHRTLHHG